MEPHAIAYLQGSDRVSKRFLSEPVVPGYSYAEVKQMLEKPYPGDNRNKNKVAFPEMCLLQRLQVRYLL